MKGVLGFFAWCILLGNLLMLGALSFTYVRGPQHSALVAKDHLTLIYTYVDAREWTGQDVAMHPVLAARLVESGHADVLPAATMTTTTTTSDAAPQPTSTTVTQTKTNVLDQVNHQMSGTIFDTGHH